jgi:hypothetical protein
VSIGEKKFLPLITKIGLTMGVPGDPKDPKPTIDFVIEVQTADGPMVLSLSRSAAAKPHQRPYILDR